MMDVSSMEPTKGQIPQGPGRRCPHMESGRSEPFTPVIPPPMMLPALMVWGGDEKEDAVEDVDVDDTLSMMMMTVMMMMMWMWM